MLLFLSLTLEQTQYIGWAVAIASTIGAVLIGRRLRPAEKAAFDLQVLTTYKESLEKQLDELRAQSKKDTAQIQDLLVKITTLEKDIDILRTSNEQLKGKDDANIKIITGMSDRLLEAQVMAQIMRTQRDKIVREFKLPTNVSDIKD